MSPEWPRDDGGQQPVVSDARESPVPWTDESDEDGVALPDETGPSMEEALETVFGLGSCERAVYRQLVGAPDTTTRELARALDVDRSSVNRALSTLLDRDLATRRPRILDEGGQVYYYTARSPAEVRQRLHDGLDVWTEVARDRVDEFVDGTDVD